MRHNSDFPKYPGVETAKCRPHPKTIPQLRMTEALMYYGWIVHSALVSQYTQEQHASRSVICQERDWEALDGVVAVDGVTAAMQLFARLKWRLQ